MLKFINIFAFVKILKTVNMNVKLKVLTIGAIFFLGEVVSAQQKRKDTISTKEIEEVVVVAYGKQKKETVVGSNTLISAKKLEQRSITNIAQAIDGAGPGIQVSTSTGQPGSAPAVRIRGFSSVNLSNEPLYVVDGSPYPTGIGFLNPNDIESMTILKDAASTSLYGSSAANGVVLITTKKGKRGRDVINFTALTGITERAIPEYDRVNASQYYPLVWESLRNGYRTSNPTATIATANAYATNNLITVLKNNVYNVADNQLVVDGVLNPNASLKYSDLDWQKDLVKKGFRQSYDLNYSGGTDKTTYFASIGYLNETGYIIKSDYERLTSRLNIDSQMRDWLKVGINLSAASSFGNNAVDGASNNSSYINPFSWTRTMGPIYSPYAHDANGNTLYDSNGQKVYDIAAVRGADAASGRHVIQETLLNRDFSKTFLANSRSYAEFKLAKGLTATMNVAYDIRNFKNTTYTNKIIGDAAPAGAASRTSVTNQTITFNQIVNYKKSLGNHNFDLTGGHESIKYIYEYLYGYKQGQVASDNDELVNFITPTSLTSQTDNYRKESYFARLNYDFSEKYLLSGSIRRDGSSRFAPDQRWGTFWSVGAGWRVNKESFLENVKFVNDFKIRGSYGEVGNDQNFTNSALSFYAYQSLYNLGYNNATEAGILLGLVSDPNITWETNKQFDIGVDFAFLNNRISGSVEYYKRSTTDLIFAVPTAVSAGIPGSSVYTNVGDMFNKGIEATLNLAVVKKTDFGWDLTVNASTIKNELTRLPDGQTQIISGTKKLMVGHSIYDYWLRQWYGVDSSDGSPLFLVDDAYANTPATDIRTVNGVLVTTNYAKAKYDYSGSAIPKLYGSFGTTLRYKNLSLNTMFTYQIGGKTYDSNYAALMSAYTQGGALSTDILERWTTPGQVTNVPRMDASTYVSSNAASSRWLVKSDFISLRSASLAYTFNTEDISQYGIRGLKLFISGENIWSKTARKGLEPVQSFNGTTTNRYTPARVYSLGLNVTF
ncbi:SusC/RagA family TonB-linked outer membrane protein [Chryseobacterium gambrini]|uniref:SusC/RagA family TonB-linked outer membrane protein n=1 Tax=Chryseobacterium gambrini TaxID=373672 RepID=A0AAJ1R1Y4_9FLAO|nr:MULTISPECIES: SusC/RagA family TonB-linked outer membrane protein [Chryseobacterium]MDN4012401.1 SusC/RagA family TonB-linked outer membrane protein [Chryseobacterium gambrini]MDN4029959.1 SusC/RagA family TonB-linked outer membrane protein [Chryseobacterium gambrini]